MSALADLANDNLTLRAKADREQIRRAQWEDMWLAVDALRAGMADWRVEVREIGERLHLIGGMDAMQHVYSLIVTMWPQGEGGEAGWHPSQVAAAWDGVGDWQW